MRLLNLQFDIKDREPSFDNGYYPLRIDATGLNGFCFWAMGKGPNDTKDSLIAVIKEYVRGSLRKDEDPFKTIQATITYEVDDVGFWWSKTLDRGGFSWKTYDR